jgi:hypothetical protein
MDRQIMCITRKAPPTEDCTCIQYVGAIDSDYLIPVSEVIKQIESGKDRFYVLDHKAEIKVYVTVAKKGDLKYIRARDYDTHYDELLKVGECKVTNRSSNERASLLIHGIKEVFGK